MKTCPHCSTENFWPTSLVHDESQTFWEYSFCTACGYQTESHSSRPTARRASALAAVGGSK